MISTRRERIGWYFYDWANSAFSTTVITVFLGPYLTTLTRAAADPAGYVYPLGIPVFCGSFFPYMVSLSVILQVILLPIAGAIADSSNLKKTIFALAAFIGATATSAMYFLQGSNYLLGGGLFLIANITFGVSCVIYNSFLVDIAEPDRRDVVSSIGWAIGYLGGGLVLAGNLVLFSNAESFHITTGDAVRISLCSAGVWWGGFTFMPLLMIKSRRRDFPPMKLLDYFTKGFAKLTDTLRKAKQYPRTLLFLVQAVIVLASQFGQEELKLTMETLTKVILMVQFVAFAGSLFFNYIAKILGTKESIIITILIWIGALIYAFGFLHGDTGFYMLGAVIGLVLGGTQALSRSLYSLFIPKGEEAEYFSLYEVSDKGTSWMGPLLFGLSLQLSNSYRLAILSLILFFVVGLILLLKVNVKKTIEESGNELPHQLI